MDIAWFIETVAKEITQGCHCAGIGDFTTKVVVERGSVSFGFPLYVPTPPKQP